MRTSSSAPPLMANPFVRAAGQLMFPWSLVGIELETLTSYDRLKLGSKKLDVYQALMQHVARDNSGLSLARRKDATCFLRWIMSMMSDSTILACHQRASGSKTVEKKSLNDHLKRVLEYWYRKRRWCQAIPREPQKAGRGTEIL